MNTRKRETRQKGENKDTYKKLLNLYLDENDATIEIAQLNECSRSKSTEKAGFNATIDETTSTKQSTDTQTGKRCTDRNAYKTMNNCALTPIQGTDSKMPTKPASQSQSPGITANTPPNKRSNGKIKKKP